MFFKAVRPPKAFYPPIFRLSVVGGRLIAKGEQISKALPGRLSAHTLPKVCTLKTMPTNTYYFVPSTGVS